MKRWTIERYDENLARTLAAAGHISDLTAFLLVRRGVKTVAEAESFLRSNLRDHLRPPSSLPNCAAVAEALLRNVKEKRKITIYGDYDVDGITGIVILEQALRDVGGNVRYYVPSRLDEGYGLHSDAVKNIAADGTQTIITVDCGINSVAEAETAKQCGIELLLTDHHLPGAVLPDAAKICHAALPDTTGAVYPFPHLCGAATAFKIAWALGQLANDGLDKPVSDRFRRKMKGMLALAALGTLADFVPLLDENRALVRGGLPLLADACGAGMRELLERAKFRPVKPSGEKNTMTAEFAAFQIAPRLNAAGRLGQAGLAVELLLSADNSRIRQLAELLENYNEKRKQLEREIQKEAEKQIREQCPPDSSPAFVLAGDWHRGVIGIVAGRLASQYHRPVILFAKDKMKRSPPVGSARGISGFNLLEAVSECREHLLRYGGHSGAAGLTIQETEIEAFREAFSRACEKRIPQENRVAEVIVDGVFPLGAFTYQAVREVLSLAPFGNANPHPVFVAENVTVQNPRLVGKDKNVFNAEFRQRGTVFKGYAFNRQDWAEALSAYSPAGTETLDIAFQVNISDYNGKIELEILDWHRHGETNEI